MCTIGARFVPRAQGSITFKQCDLIPATQFLPPEVVPGSQGIRYLPLMRVGCSGPWSGVNDHGVSFVAADAYLAPDAQGKPVLKAVSGDIFAAYTRILSDHTTAAAAAAYMTDFYKGFGQPDILLIADAREAYFIETNAGVVECIRRSDGFFASTNHFRMLYGGVLYPNNHSSYLRLARAEAILEANPEADGPVRVLSDQYFGETVYSVCRVNRETPPQEQPYYTQASALFAVDGSTVTAAYQLNGNPRSNPYTVVQDVFGSRRVVEGISGPQVGTRLFPT